MAALVAIVIGIATTGCVSVRLESADGAVRVERSFGIVRIQVSEPRTAVVGSVTGLGAVADPLGWSLGYTRQRWALLGPQCRAVVWSEAGTTPSSDTTSRLGEAAGLCLVEGD